MVVKEKKKKEKKKTKSIPKLRAYMLLISKRGISSHSVDRWKRKVEDEDEENKDKKETQNSSVPSQQGSHASVAALFP